MNTSPTPGPWVAQLDGLSAYQPYGIYSQSTSTYDGKQYTDDPVALYVMQHDARLIAAAPDLLAACKAVLEDGFREADRMSWADDLCRQLAAAIAKAEGKQETG